MSSEALAIREHSAVEKPQRGVRFGSFTEVLEFSRQVVGTPFCPAQFKDAASIALVVMHGLEVGLGPMAALRGIALINGKPALYGDALMAVVMGSGLLEDMEESHEGEGDTRRAVCRVKRRGMKTERTAVFSMADAKKAGLLQKQTWNQYTDRMLAMRARGFALRDAFADVLAGLISEAEASDYPESEERNVTQIRPVTAPKPRGEELLERLRERAPETAAVMDAHMPATMEPDVEAIDAEGAAELGVILDAEPEEAAFVSELTDRELAVIRDWIEETKTDTAKVLRAYGVERLEALTRDEADDLLAKLKTKRAKK